jgi:4-amino-4-deoxy-L-arabinose transferase-like glycosyltransferase
MMNRAAESFFLPTDSGKRWLAFACFVIVVICHHAFVYLGLYSLDDINYARYAAQVASGDFKPFNASFLLELRWMVIYVTAFFYRLFGINEFTSSACGMLCVFGTGYLIKLILKREPVRVYILALLLYFFNYHTFFSTHRIFADSPVTLFGFLTFYIYQRASVNSGDKYSLYALCFSASVFCIMLSKETVVLLLPLFLIFLVRDLRSKRMTRFWVGATLTTAAFLFLYLLAFKVATGDWLYRYHLLREESYPCNYDLLPFSEVMKRIGYLLWNAFLLNGDLIVYLFAVCGFIYRNKITQPRQMKEFGLASVILLLTANFMSFSLTSYVPLCQDARHFLFIVPFAAVSGSFLLKSYVEKPAKYPLLPLLFALATLAIFAVGGGEMKYIYLLIVLGLISIYVAGFFKKKPVKYSFCFIFFVVCFAIRPFYDLIDNKYAYYADHKKLVQTVFQRQISSGTVYSAFEITAEINEYFLGFKTGDIHFESVNRYRSGTRQSPNLYLLINGGYIPRSEAYVDQLIQSRPASLKLIRRYGQVSLYFVEDRSVLDSLAGSSLELRP